MKNLLLLIAAIMLFTIVGNAQKTDLTGTWKAADNPNLAELVQNDGYITFANGSSHIGAGYMVSQSKAVLIQTMSGDGCSVDMYLIFNIRSKNQIDLTYEFLESKCGWTKGAKGSTTLTRQ